MKMHSFTPRRAIAATGAALVIACAVALGAQAGPAPAPQGVPAPKILVIDRQALMGRSKVGQDIARQIQVLSKAAEAQLKSEGDALQHEKQSLEQQVAILAPDVKAQKVRAFEAKMAAFQKKVQDKQLQIRYGVILAQRQVEQIAGPIVQGLMQERGANLLIDRQAIVIGAPGLDVTAIAIQRLDQKLPTVKVQLASPPPELLQRMQQQQQQG